MQVTSRHHLRSDEIRSITDHIASATGVDLEGEQFERVEFEESIPAVILVDGAPHLAEFSPSIFLTVRGANAYEPTRRLVTVDAGAVSFVSDGADIMRPGIVEADPGIDPGDLVIIVEETHGKALAIGESKVSGDDLTGDQGKVIASIHHVGDELFEFVP